MSKFYVSCVGRLCFTITPNDGGCPKVYEVIGIYGDELFIYKEIV